MSHALKNIMSVDLEDYYCDLPFVDWPKYQERVTDNTKLILDLFERYNVSATFFTLGYVAEKFPELIETIVAKGHEIATHSYAHLDARKISEDEFEILLENLKPPLKEITLVAFHVAMRQKEILHLKWDHVDLDKNIIRLKGEDTKTGFKRRIPIHPRVLEMLQGLYECKVSNHVFLSNGKPIKVFSGNLKRLWDLAVKKSELGDFTFHDLRHCAINNLRLAGNDHFTIMAISGHKTTSVFKRYNVVTEEEVRSVSWI